MHQIFTRRADTSHRIQEKKQNVKALNANVPLQTTLFLLGYVQKVISRGTLSPAMYATMLAPVLGFQEWCV